MFLLVLFFRSCFALGTGAMIAVWASLCRQKLISFWSCRFCSTRVKTVLPGYLFPSPQRSFFLCFFPFGFPFFLSFFFLFLILLLFLPCKYFGLACWPACGPPSYSLCLALDGQTTLLYLQRVSWVICDHRARPSCPRRRHRHEQGVLGMQTSGKTSFL